MFLTGHADFALESYDYEPVDYLIKPVDLSRLARTFERLEDRREQRRRERWLSASGRNMIW